MWKFCGKTQFLDSLGRFTRNYLDTVPFHKISTPGNWVKLRYFTQWTGGIMVCHLHNKHTSFDVAQLFFPMISNSFLKFIARYQVSLRVHFSRVVKNCVNSHSCQLSFLTISDPIPGKRSKTVLTYLLITFSFPIFFNAGACVTSLE